MKQSDLITIGLAGLAVYLLAKSGGLKLPGITASAPAKAATPAPAPKTTEVLSSDGGAFDTGWRYFTDGTSIDPQGNYYSGNVMIWANPVAVGSYV